MKHFLTAAILLALSFSRVSAQDTLHIYYAGLNTKLLDSNEVKITKWAKSLGGKKVDIQGLAYYNDKSLKDYSQQRSDELFLILNRKAREVINIKSIGPVKGEKSQRSKVDIAYWPAGSQEAAAAKAAEEKAAAEKAKKEEKAKEAAIAEKKKEEKKEAEPKKEKAKPEKKGKDVAKTDEKPAAATTPEGVTAKPAEVGTGADELNSAPTTTISENEPMKVMVNGEWVELDKNGKKVKKKKKN